MNEEQAAQITSEVMAEQELPQESQQSVQPEQTNQPEQQEQPKRHPRLPAKFKDVDGIINAYENLEKKLGSTRPAGAPENYSVDIAEDYQDKWSIPDDDEMLTSFKSYAKENGLSQEQFNSVINFHIKNSLDGAESISSKMSEERASILRELGYNSTPEIAEREIKDWVMNNSVSLEENDVNYLMKDPVALKVISELKSKSGHSVPAPTKQNAESTMDRLRTMRADEGFHSDGDKQKKYYKLLTESALSGRI